MSPNRSLNYLISLVHELISLPHETEWVEFKENNDNPELLGEYISALANSAALHGKAQAYIVWGIQDGSHQPVGTQFAPKKTKVGNEELENWLLKSLSPKIHFQFFEFEMNEKAIVVLEISRAYRQPVQFKSQEYIRKGSYKKKLKDLPEAERQLWRVFDQSPFEDQLAAHNLKDSDVLSLLDYPRYFELLGLPLPADRSQILASLSADEFIQINQAGTWDILNLGAILLAKNLDDFRSLKRKKVRVIFYRHDHRIETHREFMLDKGYANGFQEILNAVLHHLPTNEVIEQAFRKEVPMYPELAIRELIVNALIHQDFFITGSGPMIEIFNNRMEISNPGKPLIEVKRFLDNPPRSRNESLASWMRRIGLCEERGSGVDKVVFQVEVFQLPAPSFEINGDNTVSVLFAHQDLTKMEKPDRIRACYQHACLKYVQRDYMTNSSIRERFGIEVRNSAIASRLIREALDEGAIKPFDEQASKKFMKYIPFWAG